jgi:hypothetical protein
MPPRRRRTVAGIDQDDLLDPEALADPDSSFCEISGVRVHHKVCAAHDDDGDGDQASGSAVARTKIGLPIVLLHGFGASVFSWSRVMRPLARIAGANVLAFDRPAFGLTARAGWSGDDTKPLNPYSMAFSAMATLAFIDQLGAEKAILVGYRCTVCSLNCLQYQCFASLLIQDVEINVPVGSCQALCRLPCRGGSLLRGAGTGGGACAGCAGDFRAGKEG